MAAAVSSSVSISDMIYRPPPLPDYLSRAHDLKLIVGVPTEEEIKVIHDAIRAVNSLSNFPALYDHKLSTQLAQYLFTIQMAVYRNEYPSSIFPVENTYIHPPVPSHIPISLEPVVGAPSDEQLESAHGVVRAMENLANSPFFDSGLSAKLSQHLFSIQFARYIQDSNQGQFAQKSATSQLRPRTNETEPSNVVLGAPNDEAHLQAPQAEHPAELVSGLPSLSHAVPLYHSTSEPAPVSHSNSHADNLGVTQQLQETNQLLARNEDLLKDIRRTLVWTYFYAHRGIGSNSASDYTINPKGEAPMLHELPRISSHNDTQLAGTIDAQVLARYLDFYGIGADLIEEDTRNLKQDKEADAQKLLASYLRYGQPRYCEK